jgi:myo-inositol-1-phosphate synthase
MIPSSDSFSSPILLIVAGAKGAVGSTLAAAVAALQENPEAILPSLTTAEKFFFLGPPQTVGMAGWDRSEKSLEDSLFFHGVLPDDLWKPYKEALRRTSLRSAPDPGGDARTQVKELAGDIRAFEKTFPRCRPVLINLLPAAAHEDLTGCRSFSRLYASLDQKPFPDMVYTLAALQCGLPVINFTSNAVEIPLIRREAEKRGLPLCGRDGKTGQTYLKVVLASALKARSLKIEGWYSLNILGNADGANLMEPGRSAGKLRNKTELLDEILEYPVAAHKVCIDYHPPRGDAKEAWDVIDFQGLFGLPMSLRLNLLGRDSILAAPLILDLARWATALHRAGRSGLIPELGFFFKKPLGTPPPRTFQEQMDCLSELERACQQTDRP